MVFETTGGDLPAAGQDVEVTVSDPWDFADACGNSFVAEVLRCANLASGKFGDILVKVVSRAARQDLLEFRVRTCDILEMTVTFWG
jgi:hypothetical protein